MKEVEIRRTGKVRDVYALFIDGKRVRNKDISVDLYESTLKPSFVKDKVNFTLYGWFDSSSEAKERLFELKFSELINLKVVQIRFYRLSLLELTGLPVLKKGSAWSSPYLYFYGENKDFEDVTGNSLYIDTDLDEWNVNLWSWDKKFSFDKYNKEFNLQANLLGLNLVNSKDSNKIHKSSFFIIDIENLEEKVGNFIERHKQYLSDIHNKTIEILEQSALKENSIKEFDFPPDVRVVCEQYLQYFVNFLQDVGVKATANIEHDKLGRTLFKVQPENPKIALATIREALEIYLELPMSPLVDEENISDSKMLILRAEINTLKTRLDLAQIKQIETEKRAYLQSELIDAQKKILKEKDNQIQTLQKFEPRNFEPSIVYESVVETNYVDAEIVEETSTEKLTETSNKEIDLGLVTVKPTKIGLGVEANTPRLTRLGIKKGKELFDYLDKKFNSEEEK